jgi:hypothetical protein
MQQLEQQLQAAAEAAAAGAAAGSGNPACLSRSGIPIGTPAVAQSSGVLSLGFSAGRDATSAAAFAQEAAARAAAMNAAGSSTQAAAGYAMTQVAERPASSTGVVAEVVMASAASLSKVGAVLAG